MVAEDRAAIDTDSHLLADVIRAGTVNKGIFIAPCNGKVTRICTNAIAYVDMATSGTATAKVAKAVIGGSDVDICATIAIGAATVPTAETAIDGVLSTTAGAVSFITGQLIYAVLVVSNHAVSVIPEALTLSVEWTPTDSSQ
jgi:hypothetical protein